MTDEKLLQAMARNLASLNEIVTELTAEIAAGPAFAALARETLRDHSHALGFAFQGESPPGWYPDNGAD